VPLPGFSVGRDNAIPATLRRAAKPLTKIYHSFVIFCSVAGIVCAAIRNRRKTMAKNGRRAPDETARLKQALKHELTIEEDGGGEEDGSHKRRRTWQDDNRSQDRQSKKQRQRNPEWND